MQLWITRAPDLAKRYSDQFRNLAQGDRQQLRTAWAEQLRSFAAAFPDLAALSYGTEIPAVKPQPPPQPWPAKKVGVSSYVEAQQRQIAELERTDPARATRMRKEIDIENGRFFTELQNRSHQEMQMINSNIQFG